MSWRELHGDEDEIDYLIETQGSVFPVPYWKTREYRESLQSRQRTMEFRKYMHVERYGNDEVQGIELGECHIFPKLDGTNTSIWMNDGIKAGSRNRQLSLENDNAGFFNAAIDDERYIKLLSSYPHWRLYGEWLVPHSLKTYREDAWNVFYVFDVYDDAAERYLHYNEYAATLDAHGIDYLMPLAVIRNATYDNLLREVEGNQFLIQDGQGKGEGVVIKNYSFENRFGNVCWAKIVTNEFKEKNAKAFGHKEIDGTKMVEQDIADEYVTAALVDKTYAKIVNENQGWNSKYIPQLLGRVFYDLVNEELWNILKKKKNPTINFRTLNTLVIHEIKRQKPELF